MSNPILNVSFSENSMFHRVWLLVIVFILNLLVKTMDPLLTF